MARRWSRSARPARWSAATRVRRRAGSAVHVRRPPGGGSSVKAAARPSPTMAASRPRQPARSPHATVQAVPHPRPATLQARSRSTRRREAVRHRVAAADCRWRACRRAPAHPATGSPAPANAGVCAHRNPHVRGLHPRRARRSSMVACRPGPTAPAGPATARAMRATRGAATAAAIRRSGYGGAVSASAAASAARRNRSASARAGARGAAARALPARQAQPGRPVAGTPGSCVLRRIARTEQSA